MSHFVSAEVAGDLITDVQIATLCRGARALSRTGPLRSPIPRGFFCPASSFDWVRAGYALYGGNPTPDAPNPMRAVAALDILVQQTRWIEAGESCGYNARWTARRRTRLATLLAGYADGLPFGAGGTDAKPGASALDRGACAARSSAAFRWTC